MKKAVITAVALTLALCLTVGGTLAWLMDKTQTVTNTFTHGDVDITLTETKPDNFTAKMVPGATIEKDPEVTVVDGSEDCWLFVKLEESDNLDTYISYDVADGWKLVPGTTNVYYREVAADAAVKTFSVLKDDEVTVKAAVTKEDMALIDGVEVDGVEEQSAPTLKFTAYAVQSANLTKADGTAITDAAAAWDLVK